MSNLITDLTGEIRGAKAADRPRGHTAPSTRDVAQSPAVTQPNATPARGAQLDFPVEGLGGPARRDHANHFGWKLQAGMEIRSYAETIAVRDAAAGATVIMDPALATIWRINAAGNLTLQISDIPESTVGGAPASRVISLVIYMQRAAGAAVTWPAGTLWGADVRDPENGLLEPPESARMDVFVLNKVPSIGWVGFVAALGLGTV